MNRRQVSYANSERADFAAVYDWIDERAGASVADRYVRRLQDFCEDLDVAAERGTLRADVLPGLRTVGFERRITVAFVVDDDTVTILRLFARGRDWESDFG